MLRIFEMGINYLTRQKSTNKKEDLLKYKQWLHEKEDKAYLQNYDPAKMSIPQKILCHAYWHGLFGRKQAFSVKSFLATQDLGKVELWLWLDEDNGYEGYEKNEWLKPLLPHIKVLSYNPSKRLEGSRFQNQKWIFDQKRRIANRADGLRIWALHEFGGFYFDLDVMFIKDLTPLFLGDEYLYAWEYQPYANSAILFLRKGSYLNEYIWKKVDRCKTTLPWVLFQYKDRKLKHLHVYPCNLFDPFWQAEAKKELDGMPIASFEEFFIKSVSSKASVSYRNWFPGAYAYHWHNCWKTEEAEGSYFSIFEAEFNNFLNK